MVPMRYAVMPGVAHQRAAGLDQHPRRGVERRLHAPHLDVRVVLDRGGLLLGGVGDAEAAADVQQVAVEVDEVGQDLDRARVRLQLEDLGADVRVDADEVQPLRCAHPPHGLRRASVLEPEAELRVELPGLHVAVRRGLDPGSHADQHVLRPRREALGALDLVEGVEHQVPDARVECHLQLGLGLVVAVHEQALRIDAGAQREVAARPRTRRPRTAPPPPSAGRPR